MIEGAPGHGEGHNSGMPLNIIAALAVKKVMEREHLHGHDPAVAGRGRGTGRHQGVLRARRDVQRCRRLPVRACRPTISACPAGRALIRTAWCRSSISFKGESAHAAGAPWRGRSALDAVELMDVGWNFRREHLRLAQRVHYVITNGGDQPNVVPPNAAVWYYFREADYEHIMNMWKIGDNMAQGGGADD